MIRPPRATVRPEGFYVNEKFQWHQLGSNQRPSDSWHSTLTTVLRIWSQHGNKSVTLTAHGIWQRKCWGRKITMSRRIVTRTRKVNVPRPYLVASRLFYKTVISLHCSLFSFCNRARVLIYVLENQLLCTKIHFKNTHLLKWLALLHVSVLSDHLQGGVVPSF